MQILSKTLYILIEGAPTSPEVVFIRTVIRKLITQDLLSDIEYEVIEIGGSGNFNSIGQLIYHKSQLHQSIPVIAITDRDFRTQEKIEQISSKLDSNLIRDKSVRIIYWKRHEWENFLLEETETIANLFNQISTKKTGEKKTYRKNTGNNLTKSQLEQWLRQYFQNSIMTELFECLKFQFRENADFRLTLDRIESLSLLDMRTFFEQQIVDKASESKNRILGLRNMLEDIIISQDFHWESYINNPPELDFQEAKIFFRGKEALKDLHTKANQYLKVEHLEYDRFCKELILPELSKNTNSLIVQELGIMLRPYFQQAANLTGIE
jgi:RNA-binding protein YhbY